MATNDSTPEIVEIQLNTGHIVIIDSADADADMLHPKWVSRIKRKHLYAMRFVRPYIKKRGKQQAIHRLILERMIGRTLEQHEKVDHINGNTLDNRRSNLRLATNAQNSSNAKLSIANKSGYKGVAFRNGNWIAEISPNGKKIYLGRFSSAVDAAIAYNIAAKKYYKEFARFNPIKDWESITPIHPPRKTGKPRTRKPYYTRVRYQGQKWAVIVTRNGKQKTLSLFATNQEAKEYEQRYILENAA